MNLLLKNGTLIDGNGGKPLVGMDVHVRGDKIQAIVPTSAHVGAAAPEATCIDCTDKFVLSGLVDSHVHLAFVPYDHDRAIVQQLLDDNEQTLALREMRHAQECLVSGITTVRDCGGKGLGTLWVRDAIAAGMLPGPRILASGMPVTTTFGHLYWCGLEADGVDQVRVAVRRLAKAGVDFIKVMATGGILTGNAKPLIPQYSQAELDVLCEEARRLDKYVAAHVGSVEGIRRCVKAGVNTIEHCGWSNPDGTSGYDPRIAEQMAEKGVFVGCTVVGITRNRLLPDEKVSESERQRMLEQFHQGWAQFREMKAMGVQFALSTDAGCRSDPFTDIYLSLVFYSMMMDASPLETLTAATLTAAKALRVDKMVGTIELGKQADILILDADPLQDLYNTRRVNTVIARGEIAVSAGRLSLPTHPETMEV
jgi:imidazolonepropionase-like amidohydrolase